MNNLEEEFIYEEKLDQLSVELEELVLDAFIAAIQKLKQRNKEFMQSSLKSHENGMEF
jgi:hypothetical protein